MEGKPIHYDGSAQNYQASTSETTGKEPFVLTDEMRKSIGGNPYVMENIE
ncbi:hypothetical protein [Peribacillus saganii]|nr:hypothetical protein [Peribacillus saganii]